MRAKSVPRQSHADQVLQQLYGQHPQDGTIMTADLADGAALQVTAAEQQQQQHGVQQSFIAGSTRGRLAIQVQWIPDAVGKLQPYTVMPDLFDSSDDESREPLRGPRWSNLMLQLQQQQQQSQLQEHTAEEHKQQAGGSHHHPLPQQQQELEQQQQQWGKQTLNDADSATLCNELVKPAAVQQQQPTTHHTQDAAAVDKAKQEATAASAATAARAAAAAWSSAKHRCCQNCGASHSLSWTQTTVGRTSKLRCKSCTQHFKATGKHRSVSQDDIVLLPPSAAVAAALAAAAKQESLADIYTEQASVSVCHNCCSCITTFHWRRECRTAAAAAAGGQQQQEKVLLCNSCALYQRLAGKPRPVSDADRAAAQVVTAQLVAACQDLQQQHQQLQQWLAEQHKRLQLQREWTQRSRANKRQQRQQQQRQNSGLQALSAAAAAAAAGVKRKHQHASDSAGKIDALQQQAKKSQAASAAAAGKPPKPAATNTASAAAGSSKQQGQQQCSTGMTMSANNSSSDNSQTLQISSSTHDGGTAASKPRNGAGSKPPPFKLLRRNKYVCRQRAVLEKDDISVCNCQPSNGQCCREVDGCLNRALKVCCAPGTCPAGDACQNTTLTKRKLPALSVVPVGMKGWGVVAKQDIQSGTLVAEYLGEVVPVSEGIKRLAAYAAQGVKHTYLMDLSKSEVIDATLKGGVARFINHSCEPNCETQKWQDGGELVIAIVAMRDIPAGTELTYDYRYQSHAVPHARTRCCCGAASCSGWLGSLDPQAHLRAQLEQHHREAAKRVMKQIDAVTGEEYHVDVLDPMDSDDGAV